MKRYCAFYRNEKNEDFKFRDEMALSLLSNDICNFFAHNSQNGITAKTEDEIFVFVQDSIKTDFHLYCRVTLGEEVFATNTSRYDLPMQFDIVDFHFTHLFKCSSVTYPNEDYIVKHSTKICTGLIKANTLLELKNEDILYEQFSKSFENTAFTKRTYYKHNHNYFHIMLLNSISEEKKSCFNTNPCRSNYMDTISKVILTKVKKEDYNIRYNDMIFAFPIQNNKHKVKLQTVFNTENNDLDSNFYFESKNMFMYHYLDYKHMNSSDCIIVDILSNRYFSTAGLRDLTNNSMIHYTGASEIKKNTCYAPDGLYLIINKKTGEISIPIIELKITYKADYSASYLEQADKFCSVFSLKYDFNKATETKFGGPVNITQLHLSKRRGETAYKYGRILYHLLCNRADIKEFISDKYPTIDFKKAFIDMIANYFMTCPIEYVFIINSIQPKLIKNMKEILHYHNAKDLIFTLSRNYVFKKSNYSYIREYEFNKK